MALALAVVGWNAADGATYYWDTSSGLWTTGANWSGSPISGGTTGTVPANDTTSDSAVFNQSSVNGNQQVQLSQNQSIAGLLFSNSGSTSLVSDGATVRTLSVGTGGITLQSGAGAVTIGGANTPVNVAIAGDQAFSNNSSSPLTFSGTVSRAATAGVNQTLSIAGTGNTIFSGRLVSGGTAGSLLLSKSGMGSLTFNGATASSFGASTVQGGTIIVDFVNHTTGTALFSTGDVTFAGGNVLIEGKSAGSTSQTLGTITANPGGGSILADANGGSTTVVLGNITPNAGGTLLIGQAPGSTGSVTFTRFQGPASSGAAYGQKLVFANGGGYDWATSTSGTTPYVVTAFTGYATLATTAGTDTSQSRITGNTTLAGNRTTNSLKIEDPAAGQTLALGGNTLTLTGGALLATGSNAFTITTTGGIISNAGEVVVQQYNTGGLTIAARFGGGFTAGFTKAGGGTLTLTSTNNGFTAPIFVNSGTLAIGGAGRLIGTTGTYAGNVTIATGATFNFESSATSFLSGTISGAGSFRQSGSGATTLLGATIYSGSTTISGGTLALRANAAMVNSPVITVGDTGSSGAVLDLTALTGTYTFGSNQTVAGIGMINFGTGKTVQSNGIWAPGNSIGSNAVTGNLALSGTSQFELGTPGTSASSPGTADFTSVSGTLTLGGNLVLLNNSGSNSQGNYGAGAYRLFTAPTVSGSFASVTAPVGATTTRVEMVYGSGTDSGQGVFANVYNLAVGSVTSGTSVNLGLIHAGGSFTSQAVAIANTAAAGNFSEGLNASVSGSTGNATFGGTDITDLTAGGNQSSITVGLGDTSTGGVKNGTITIGYQSNGSTTSGLSTISAGSQVVSLTGSVFSGNGIWSTNGGGMWGSQGGGTNWTSTGGVQAAPGTFTGYASTDSATFAGAVTGGTATITLGSANPSLAALTFNSGSASYQLSGGTLGLNGGTSSALVTVSSGSHGIGSAVGLSSNASIDVAANSLLTFSGVISGSSAGLTKTGQGRLVLGGANTYAGLTQVSGSGSALAIDGSVAGNVQVDAGAVLGGSGVIAGNLGGSGLIGPGSSPGILTVQGQLDATSTTAFAFELSGIGAPAWNNASASINDVLRLTAASPFTSSLAATNIVNVYFDRTSLANGDTFLGGFFVDNLNSTSNLLTNGLGNAVFQYFVKGDGNGGYGYNGTNYYSLSQYMATNSGVTGVTQSVVTVGSADFTGGTVTTGQVTQFVIVPEPGAVALALCGIATASCAAWRRRTCSAPSLYMER